MPQDIVLDFKETGLGLPEDGKIGQLSQRLGTLDPRLFLPCANPACKKGGFLLRSEIEKAVRVGKTEIALDLPCVGYVGALRSERGPAQGCANRLHAEVRIAYRHPQ